MTRRNITGKLRLGGHVSKRDRLVALTWYDGGLIGPKLASTSSEVIDGEAIIMNHDNGVYFNSVGSGALLWQAVSSVRSFDEIVAWFARSYGLESKAVEPDVAAFLDLLKEYDLIEVSSLIAKGELPEARAGEPYARPELDAHNDLADLLLLDPVHVGPMASWPTPNEP